MSRPFAWGWFLRDTLLNFGRLVALLIGCCSIIYIALVAIALVSQNVWWLAAFAPTAVLVVAALLAWNDR